MFLDTRYSKLCFLLQLHTTCSPRVYKLWDINWLENLSWLFNKQNQSISVSLRATLNFWANLRLTIFRCADCELCAVHLSRSLRNLLDDEDGPLSSVGDKNIPACIDDCLDLLNVPVIPLSSESSEPYLIDLNEISRIKQELLM